MNAYMQDIALSLTSWSMSAAFSRTRVHWYNWGTNGTKSNDEGWSAILKKKYMFT